MKGKMLVLIAAVVIIAGVMVTFGPGCKNRTRLGYSPDASRMVPIVHAGDIVEMPGRDIRWIDNPCVGNNENANPCEIREGLPSGVPFEYECIDDMPCDPEIAVDDPPVLVPPIKGTRNTPLEPDVRIEIRCDNAGNPQVEDASARQRDVIKWGKFGTGVKDGWRVTLDSDALCEEGVGPFTAGSPCTAKADAGTSYTFKLHGACSAVDMSEHKITVIER